LDKLRTTELGIYRIRDNLNLNTDDIISWCKEQIKEADSIRREGKNWYILKGKYLLTVNARSYTVITGHIAYHG